VTRRGLLTIAPLMLAALAAGTARGALTTELDKETPRVVQTAGGGPRSSRSTPAARSG
jgi:hypothetical protein